jgi:GMP synthase-like glutamine amidotransferase
MILLLDLCQREHPLSRDEFVLPIARTVQKTKIPCLIRHYRALSASECEAASGIILCGTALKDNHFMHDLSELQWLKENQVPVLGICAGMQILSKVWGGKIERGTEIGMTPVRSIQEDPLLEDKQEFSVYELHNFAPVPSDFFEVLAVSSRFPQVIRHRSLPQYGVLFHPEVRNDWVVERFLHLFMGEKN